MRAADRTVAGLPWTRIAAGALLLVIALPTLTAALMPHRDTETYAAPVLLVLATVALSASIGGLAVALPGAVVGFLVLNWYFTPPYGTFDVAGTGQLVVLSVYLGTAVLVSLITSHAARQTMLARRARAEADTLAALSGAALSDAETLTSLLERIRTAFSLDAVALETLEEGQWTVAEQTASPGAGQSPVHVPAGPAVRLALHGPALIGADQRLLRTFAGAAATALEGRILAERAAQAAAFQAADRTRTALLGAVGHDLRAPLSVLRTASDGLLDPRVDRQDAHELAVTVAEATNRLQSLVENLLDASRLQAGVIVANSCPHEAEELISRALVALNNPPRVHVHVPTDLPLALADAGLTERVLVNLLDNALRHSPAGTMVTLRGRHHRNSVLLDVVDHGPGLTPERRSDLFTAFQKRGDSSHDGVGLGLSVAHGFAEAMDASLTVHDTPGGGLTLRLSLPAAS